MQISYVSNFCAERSATSLVRLVRSVRIPRPQPCAPSSILDAVQHAATQERCASRRRSSVDGTARALRAAVGNGATVARKQIVIFFIILHFNSLQSRLPKVSIR